MVSATCRPESYGDLGMECPKCGYLMQPFETTCPRCRGVGALSPNAAAQAPERVSSTAKRGKREKKPPSMPMAIALLAVSLVCTVAGIVYYFMLSRPKIVPIGATEAPSYPGWLQWILWAVALVTAYLGLKMVKALQRGPA